MREMPYKRKKGLSTFFRISKGDSPIAADTEFIAKGDGNDEVAFQ
jgi:hypothetical protein